MARPSRQASSDDKRMSYLLSQFSPPSTEMLSSDELTHAYDTKATRWLQQTSKSAAEALAAPTPVQPRPSLVIGAQKWSGAGSSSPSRAPVTSPPTLTSPSSPPSSLSSSSQSLSASLSSSSLPSAPSPSSSHPSSTGQSSSSSGASSDSSSSLLLRRSPSSSLMSSRSHEDGLEIRMARALLLSENLTIMLPISEELTFAQLREQILTKARLRLTSSVDVSRWELAAQNADGLVFFPHPTSTPWHRFPIDELPAERGTAPCLDLLVGLPSDIAIFAAGWSQQKQQQQQQQASAVPAKSESSRRLFSQNLSAALRKSRTIRPPTIALPASTPQSLPMSRSPSPPRPSPSHHASQSPPSSQSSTSPTSTTTSTTTSALAAVSSQSVDSTGDMHQTVVSQIGMEGQLGRRRPRSTSLPLSTGVQQLFNPQQQFPKQLTRTVGFSFGRSSTESSPDASKTPPLPDAAMPVRTQSLASFAVDKLPPPSSTPPPPPPAAATTKKTNKRASQRHSRRNSTGSLSQEDTSTTTSDDNNNDDNNDADSNKSKAPYQFSMHDRLQFNSRTPIDLPRYETSKLEMELGGAYFLTDGEALDLLESPSSPTSLSPTSARHRPAVLAKAGDSEAHGKAAAKTPSRSQQSIRTFLKKRDTTRKDDDAISIDPLVVNAPHGSDLDLSAIRKIRKLAGHLGGSGSEVWSVSVAGWQCAMKIGQASVVGSSMLQEISMLAVLPPHPHIVRYLGHSLVGDTQLFLMELFDMQFEDYLNGLLAKQRDNQSSSSSSSASSSSSGGCSVVPQRVAVRLAYECLRAVEHMHSHGIAHRDIKPANVFLRVDAASGLPYHAAIGDFDTATRFNYLVSPCGSPMFMAPEVIASKSSGKYTQLCDNYSLGMLIYVFVAGKLPFENIPLLKIPEAVLAKQRPKIPPFVLEDPVWAQLMDVSQQLSRFAANDRLPLAKAIKLVEPLYSTL